MRIKTTVIHSLGTFESKVSGNLTEEEFKQIDSFLKQLNKVSFFLLEQDNASIYFTPEVISQAIVKVEIVSEFDEVPF